MADTANIVTNVVDGSAITSDLSTGVTINTSVTESSTVTANVITGAKGDQGATGAAGAGVAAGGSLGQFLTKNSGNDYDTVWATLATAIDAAGAVMNTDTSTAAMSFVVDEDAMTSNLDTKVPTQQSVKAYVDGIAAPTPDATTSTKGKLQLAGDLGGTAALPKIKRTHRFIVAPYGDTRPADYTCANNTNNEVEINLAINAAYTLWVMSGSAAAVDLLDGRFYIGAAVVPKSYVWLRGQGMFATCLAATSSLNAGIIDNKSTYDTNNPWIGGIISDLELDGSNMNPATEKKGINSDSLNNCKIMRVFCHDTTATGIGPDDFYGSTITECIVSNCGYMNKKTITAASWLASVITFTTSAAHGYTAGSSIIIVTGMTPSAYNGRYTVASTPTSTTFTVTGTLLNLDPGIATAFGLSSDSLIGHNGIGIASGANTHEANIITNNICIGNQNNNFLIEADNTGTDGNASYIFANNISINAGQSGFLNTGTPNVQFLNNFDYGSVYGCQVATTTQARTITAASWSGGVATYTTSLDHSYSVGTKVDIVGMTPTGYNGYYTVTSVPTSTTFTVAITSDPGTATVFGTSTRVAHDTSDTMIENNIFTYNSGYGIRINSRAEEYRIVGNTVKLGYNYGISAFASYGAIIGNSVYQNGRDGIDIETGSGTYTPITKVVVYDNHIYNNATRATYDGIEVQSGNVTAPITNLSIHDNQIFDTQDTPTQRYGIIIRTGGTISNISVNDNNLTNNGTGGILVQNTSDTISVFNNVGVNPLGKVTLGNITGSTTFGRVNGHFFTATLTGSVTAAVTSGTIVGDELTLELTQDGTGSRTISWPANVKLANNNTYALSTAASSVDMLRLIWDGTNWREVARATSLDRSNYLSYVSTSVNYSLVTTVDVVRVTVSGKVVTLPDATTAPVKAYTIKNVSSGNVSFATTSSQTVDGSTTGTIIPNQALTVVPDGSNWQII